MNAVERALIQFESNLPSTAVERFPVTGETVDNPDKAIADLLSEENNSVFLAAYNSIRQKEKQSVRDYIEKKCYALAKQHDFSLTPEKIDLLTEFIINRIATIESAIASIKSYYEETKNIATYFRRQHDLKVELSEDAVIYLVRQYINNEFSDFEKKCQELTRHFVDGFKLLSEKTGRREFEITQQALMFPESWLDRMIKNEFGVKTPKEQFRSPTHETDK